MRHFVGSFTFAAAGLAFCFWRGGLEALFICTVLAVMEVSLSFDNAVVNAKVLARMSLFWRRMFLTVGIVIAVFAVRLALPIVLVSLAADQSLALTTQQAIYDQDRYRAVLESCETSIAAFGGMFLLLLFLDFLFDVEREHHWIGPVERRLAKVGKLKSSSVFVALTSLLAFAAMVPEADRLVTLTAGIIGIALYVLLDDLKSLTQPTGSAADMAALTARGGLAGFLYLEVLDASFSLDGVVGAFAISKSVIVIMIGLAVGAMFVRSLTIFLVERGTLMRYRFLEHGAMWAIGALAVMMLIGALPQYHVPEWLTGLTGAALILLSVVSSRRYVEER